MKKHKIFIDGSNGTTGLEIHKRLSDRVDVELLTLPEEERKNIRSRKEMVINSDLSILCLPDEASKGLVIEVEDKGRILDASTAHRTNPQWVYGLPELIGGQRERIASSSRVCVPGCHASGFILLVRPLIENSVLEPKNTISGFSITGYSGGGKAMIKEYEEFKCESHKSPGQYGLLQNHKHLPEIKTMALLEENPILIPIVGDYYRGMVVTVPLQQELSNNRIGKQELLNIYKDYYKDEPLIQVKECDELFIYGDEKAGKDDLIIYVYGSEKHPVVSSVFDNLGKGASGAAVQCMNLMLDVKENQGLFVD
jgi:N-acetyl-gamma-glutamyl-phosphate reductase